MPDLAVFNISGREIGFVAHQRVFRAVVEAIDVTPDETALMVEG